MGQAMECRSCLGASLNRRAGSGALNLRRPDDLGAAVRIGASDGKPELLRRVLNRRAGSGALNPRRPDDLGAAVRVGASDGMPELLRRVLK